MRELKSGLLILNNLWGVIILSKNRFIELLNKDISSVTDDEKNELQEFLKEMKKSSFKGASN